MNKYNDVSTKYQYFRRIGTEIGECNVTTLG